MITFAHEWSSIMGNQGIKKHSLSLFIETLYKWSQQKSGRFHKRIKMAYSNFLREIDKNNRDQKDICFVICYSSYRRNRKIIGAEDQESSGYKMGIKTFNSSTRLHIDGA